MQRRFFLRHALATGVASTTLLAGAAVANTRDLKSKIKAQLGRRLDKVESRLDDMDLKQKRLIRAGAICLAVSTGIDLTILV